MKVRVFILVPLVIFSACSTTSHDGERDLDPRESDWAMASWYGEPFHGRLTASGERYDMHGISAAHKEYPFGSRFRLTHPQTGRSVTVTINDRGPFVAGRDFDLSYGAARQLGMVEEGVARLRVEPAGFDSVYQMSNESRLTSTHAGQFSLQIASYHHRDPATAFLNNIRSSYPDAFIDEVMVGEKKVYRVMSGVFGSKDEALAALAVAPSSPHRPFVKQL